MNDILKNNEWRQLASLHEKKIIALTKDWQLTRQQKKKHPVIDFLFTYYSFSFNRLKAWTPGLGLSLEGPIAPPLSENRFAEEGGIINLRSDLLPVHRLKAFEWTHSLLLKTPKNPPSFNCFGLHEWAMVYKDENIRHQSLGLRVSQEVIAQQVEEKVLNCTHLDAIRFYTKEALPLNRFHPSRDTQEDHEQSACLHANMDLYKWAFKIYPWIGSELLLDCFELAMDCRRIDMMASPYDVASLGYEAIKIETPEGREIYVQEQRRLKEKAEKLRLQLSEVYEKLIVLIKELRNT